MLPSDVSSSITARPSERGLSARQYEKAMIEAMKSRRKRFMIEWSLWCGFVVFVMRNAANGEKDGARRQ